MFNETLENKTRPYDQLRRDWLTNYLSWYVAQVKRLRVEYPGGFPDIPIVYNQQQATLIRTLADNATPASLAYFIVGDDLKISAQNDISIVHKPDNNHLCHIWKREDYKLWINGAEEQEIDKKNGVGVRIYLAIKPFFALRVFYYLAQELLESNVLKTISMCLVLEEILHSAKPENNSIVIYCTNGNNHQMIDQILLAIEKVKRSNSQLFELSDQEYHILLAGRLATYRLEIDRNTTLVEVTGEEFTQNSWDTARAHEIDNILGITLPPVKGTEIDRLGWRTEQLQRKASRTMYDKESSHKIRLFVNDPSSLTEGSVHQLRETRSMTCPALVNYKQQPVVRLDEKLMPLTNFWQAQADIS